MNLTGSLKSQHKIYRVAALPIAGLLAFVLHTPDGLTWLDAGILGFALAAVGELISLPAWYSCRIAPVQRTQVWRLLATHVMAAGILSFLWLGVGKLFAHADIMIVNSSEYKNQDGNGRHDHPCSVSELCESNIKEDDRRSKRTQSIQS